MKNRTPILSAVVLSLLVHSSLSAQQLEPIPPGGSDSHPAPAADTATTAGTPTSDTPTGAIGFDAGNASAQLPSHTATYVVVKGDSLTRIAEKFNTTRKKLEALNNLALGKVTPGQTILVPSHKKSKALASTDFGAKKAHHEYPAAQPVQNFDRSASASSSPASVSAEEETSASAHTSEKPAPIAKLVSPSELAAEMAKMRAENDRLAAAKRAASFPAAAPSNVSPLTPSPTTKSGFAFKDYADSGARSTSHTSPSLYNSPKSFTRSPSLTLNQNSTSTSSASDWGNRFLQQARYLGNQGIEYDEDWRPPGETHSWTMDCSNTTRYLYKITTGIDLPRTASDQYYYLHLQGKAWDVPQTANGYADCEYLRHNLKPGDLLFWENTYRPDRQPPITHVMVFLGTNAQGQWIMAGSQSSRGGEHNRHNGGPDVYVFRPTQPCGGYTTWLGMVHHHGRFCAFGRPLEADRSKLSVATND